MGPYQYIAAAPQGVCREGSARRPFDLMMSGLGHIVFWLSLFVLALAIGAAFGAITQSLFGG